MWAIAGCVEFNDVPRVNGTDADAPDGDGGVFSFDVLVRDDVGLDVATASDALEEEGTVDAAARADVANDAGRSGCTRQADCVSNPSRPSCDEATGQCVQCIVTLDTCASTEHCNGATQTCEPGCRSDEGCMVSGGTIDGGAGARARCDTVNHTCVECVGNDQCLSGTLCVGNVCVMGCTADRACPSGQTCCAGACVDTGWTPRCAAYVAIAVRFQTDSPCASTAPARSACAPRPSPTATVTLQTAAKSICNPRQTIAAAATTDAPAPRAWPVALPRCARSPNAPPALPTAMESTATAARSRSSATSATAALVAIAVRPRRPVRASAWQAPAPSATATLVLAIATAMLPTAAR